MKVKVSVSTKIHGSKVTTVIDIPDEDLEGHTHDGKEQIISEQVLQYMYENMLDWTWQYEV